MIEEGVFIGKNHQINFQFKLPKACRMNSSFFAAEILSTMHDDGVKNDNKSYEWTYVWIPPHHLNPLTKLNA